MVAEGHSVGGLLQNGRGDVKTRTDVQVRRCFVKCWCCGKMIIKISPTGTSIVSPLHFFFAKVAASMAAAGCLQDRSHALQAWMWLINKNPHTHTHLLWKHVCYDLGFSILSRLWFSLKYFLDDFTLFLPGISDPLQVGLDPSDVEYLVPAL